nr:hypothetical protein [Nanoarchaeota archaeon]
VETGKAVNDLNKLDKATGEVAKETNAMAIASSKGAKSLGDLERASEDLTTRLKGAEFGTPEFNELNQALKDVNRQVKNTELNMEALDNEQVASEIGSVAGAVGDMSAAFVLLGGDEDSSMAETIARMEKAIGITMAFKGGIEGFISFQKLWNNTLKKTAVIQGIVTAATAAWSFVTKGATLVTKALRLALLSLPFVAIGAAITAVVAYWDDLVEGVKSGLRWLGLYDDSEEKAAARKKARAKQRKKELEQEIKLLERRAKIEKRILDDQIANTERFIALQKAKGEDVTQMEEQLLKDKISNAEKDFENTKEVEAKKRKLIEDEIKKKEKSLKSAYARNVSAYRNSLNDELAELRTQLDATVTAEKDALNQVRQAKHNEAMADAEAEKQKEEERKKRREERKKEREKEIAEEKKKAEKLVAIELKRIQDIQKLENELLATIEQLDEEARQRQQTEQQNEIDAVREKYFTIINTVKEGSDEQLRLQQYLKDEEKAINDKFRQEEKEANKQASDDKKALDKQEILDAQAIKDAKIQLALDGLTAVMDLTSAFAKDNEASQRKAFEINKKLQIAQALIQTYQGVQAIFAARAASPETILFPAAPFIAAGIALASGLANVQNIRKQQFSGGSGSGSFGGGGGVPGGGAAAPQIDAVTNTSTLLSQDAQKVYVTETDISETQNKVSVIEAQSTF